MKIYIANIKIINIQNLIKMYVIDADTTDIIVMIVMRLNILTVNILINLFMIIKYYLN
jgi:hypothetical protein